MTPDGGMPTSTVAPLRFINETACSAAPFTPTVTNTQSALRPPVSAVTRSPTSSLLALTVSVAPKSRAAASFMGSTSTAMIGRSARDPRALDGIEANAAAADDDDARAGFHPRRVDDGAHARQHAAGDERRALEGNVLRDADRLRLVDDHVLGEGAHAQAVDDSSAGAVVQRGLAVEREHFLAEDGRALRAGGAEAAIADERRHHVVAGFQARDGGADRLDDARRLVAVDGWQIAAPGAVAEENIAVADRAGARPDQNLARARLGEFDRLNRQRSAKGAADGGFGFHEANLGGKARRAPQSRA